jgi:hypothetical protein
MRARVGGGAAPPGMPWIAATVAIALLGCGGPPTDESPSGALRLFFESVATAQQATGRSRVEALEQAYGLLDARSRDRLDERSRATAALGAREHAAYEMLAAYPTRGAEVPTRAASFREAAGADADHATVTVRLAEDRSVEVPMVREDGAWRVVLDVPEIEPE